MSMLSSQADELRLMARLVRDYDYKEISRMLREAADTIESLRDRLQESYGKVPDQDEHEKQRPMESVDSREQLEWDAKMLVDNLRFYGFHYEDDPKQEIIEMLDRQAAITRAEVFEDGEYDCRTCDAKRELQERVDSLTAERDELKAFAERLETASRDKLGVTLFGVDYVTEEFMLHVRDRLTAERDELREELRIEREAVDACKGCDKVDSLTAELKHKQDVCDVQRDSFLKLEAENAELRRMLADAAEAI